VPLNSAASVGHPATAVSGSASSSGGGGAPVPADSVAGPVHVALKPITRQRKNNQTGR
jgi:hypothetical protein